MEVVVETDRVLLHRWRDVDRPPFAALNADPEVMRYFPAPLSADESDAMIERLVEAERQQGFCFWAASLRDGTFVGMVGLLGVDDLGAAVAPSVEIGWRLARRYWGAGLASEAAAGCLVHAFDTLGLAEVVSFTATANDRSRRVMERIGMHRDHGADFDHPRVPDGHPLRRHVLYRSSAATWSAPPLRR